MNYSERVCITCSAQNQETFLWLSSTLCEVDYSNVHAKKRDHVNMLFTVFSCVLEGLNARIPTFLAFKMKCCVPTEQMDT